MLHTKAEAANMVGATVHTLAGAGRCVIYTDRSCLYSICYVAHYHAKYC